MRDWESGSNSKITTFLSSVVLFAVGFCAIHCWLVKDWIALATIVAVVAGGLAGFWWGIWRTLASWLGCYAGYSLAGYTADRLIPFLENQSKLTLDRSTGLSISGVAVGSAVTLFLIILGAILRRNETIKAFDRRAGFVLGTASSSISAAMIFWVLLAAEPTIKRSQLLIKTNPAIANSSETQFVAIEKLSNVLDALNKSYVMVALKPWNPIVEVAYLRDMKSKIEASITTPSKTNRAEIGPALPWFTKMLLPDQAIRF
jgi:uncharacterized membrane protein required for colicin V production